MNKYVLWFCRLFVGILFTISGLIKVNDITGFAYKLEDYFFVFENDFGLPSKWLASMAVGISGMISIFEVIVAITLLLGFWPRATTKVLLAMIVFFTFLTGYSWILERVQDCGCFGDALKLTPMQSFFKDLILLVLIGYLYRFRNHIKPMFPPKLNAGVTIAGSLITILLTWYCYAYLPIIDFRPACVGCNLQANTTEQEIEEGLFEAKLKSYAPLINDCQIDEFKGTTLLIIIPKLHLLSDPEIKEVKQVATSVAGDMQVICAASASPSELVASVKQKHNLPFCISIQDETMLKTTIRSNPGYILMKDGLIKGKWHKNATPDRATLLNALK